MASRLNMSMFDDVEEESVAADASDVPPVSTYGGKPQITPALVDEAVDNVLRGLDYPPEVKETFRKLLASDPSTGFAGSLYMSKSEGLEYNAFPRLDKRVHHVKRVLTPEETADLVKYAPEFDFKFSNEEAHDHAAAAEFRDVDFELLYSSVPKSSYKDIGGNPLYHIQQGNAGAHVCGPIADVKDPSRAVMRRMRAMKISKDERWPVEQRVLADKYLRGDPSFVCNKLGQDCDFKAKVTIGSHVYDIPLPVIPHVMRSAGAFMHAGNVTFPYAAYQQSEGILPVARARYSVDVENNRFRMGFVGSASWMYDHNWLDFMRFGVDQVILCQGDRYVYKVTQKRGDTIFFKVLTVNGEIGFPGKQWYKLPTVPMVRVDGFDYTQGKRRASIVGFTSLVKKTYWFPQALWEDMLQHAKMEFERGVMTYDKLYNYYRAVVPRKTINGVLVAGGKRVAIDEVVALVTHVGMCAAASVSLGQRTDRAITSRIMSTRAWHDGSVFSKAMGAFWASVKATAVLLSYYPLMWICDKVTLAVGGKLADSLVAWAVEPELKQVSFSSLVGDDFMGRSVDWKEFDERVDVALMGHYRDNGLADHIRAIRRAPKVASLLTAVCGNGMAKKDADVVKEVSDSSTVVSGTTVVEPPHVSDATVAMRRAAIQEAIDESVLEERKLVEACDMIMRACTDVRGEPTGEVIRSRAEEYYQPDMWFVRNGVLVKSYLGLDAPDCRYSALYTMRVDAYTGSRFRTVLEEYFEDKDGGSIEYKVFKDKTYTGWALSIDRLVVFNGPGIRETMARALLVDHRYTITVNQAPPGAGKTYQIVQGFKQGDVAMCPVRESAVDTRARLALKRPVLTGLRKAACTVDSYLNNYDNPRVAELTADVLHADECYMTHSGRWYAAAGLLSAREVSAHGDLQQIPHVQRVQAPGLYIRIAPDVFVERFGIRRCPGDALAAWAHLFDYKARTYSKVRRSMTRSTDVDGLSPPAGCVIMTMYQADKEAARVKFKSKTKSLRLTFVTVHESEGKTYKHVWLIRNDSRPRSDKVSLFDKEQYCLVAMSRHTDSFVYVRPRNMGDLVDTWLDNAVDARAVNAAMDMASLGTVLRMA